METLKNDMEKKQMKTMSECMAMLTKKGFGENFIIKEKGLCVPDSNKCYGPNQVSIVDFYRFEGESDPADNSILYAIITDDGRKGMVSDSYGPRADALITKFFNEVEEISKEECVTT